MTTALSWDLAVWAPGGRAPPGSAGTLVARPGGSQPPARVLAEEIGSAEALAEGLLAPSDERGALRMPVLSALLEHSRPAGALVLALVATDQPGVERRHHLADTAPLGALVAELLNSGQGAVLHPRADRLRVLTVSTDAILDLRRAMGQIAGDGAVAGALARSRSPALVHGAGPGPLQLAAGLALAAVGARPVAQLSVRRDPATGETRVTPTSDGLPARFALAGALQDARRAAVELLNRPTPRTAGVLLAHVARLARDDEAVAGERLELAAWHADLADRLQSPVLGPGAREQLAEDLLAVPTLPQAVEVPRVRLLAEAITASPDGLGGPAMDAACVARSAGRIEEALVHLRRGIAGVAGPPPEPEASGPRRDAQTSAAAARRAMSQLTGLLDPPRPRVDPTRLQVAEHALAAQLGIRARGSSLWRSAISRVGDARPVQAHRIRRGLTRHAIDLATTASPTELGRPQWRMGVLAFGRALPDEDPGRVISALVRVARAQVGALDELVILGVEQMPGHPGDTWARARALAGLTVRGAPAIVRAVRLAADPSDLGEVLPATLVALGPEMSAHQDLVLLQHGAAPALVHAVILTALARGARLSYLRTVEPGSHSSPTARPQVVDVRIAQALREIRHGEVWRRAAATLLHARAPDALMRVARSARIARAARIAALAAALDDVDLARARRAVRRLPRDRRLDPGVEERLRWLLDPALQRDHVPEHEIALAWPLARHDLLHGDPELGAWRTVGVLDAARELAGQDAQRRVPSLASLAGRALLDVVDRAQRSLESVDRDTAIEAVVGEPPAPRAATGSQLDDAVASRIARLGLDPEIIGGPDVAFALLRWATAELSTPTGRVDGE